MLSWLLILSIVISSFMTKSFGVFLQKRIGQFGKPFTIFKIKTMDDGTKKASAFGIFL